MMNATMGTHDLLNELLQFVDSWWRLLEHRSCKVSCLFALYVSIVCSHRQCMWCVLRGLCVVVLLDGATPRCSSRCGCGVLLPHGTASCVSCRRCVCGVLRTTCVAVDYRTHVPMATDGLRNELMQVCNGWWRLQQCRGWKVSCLFVVYFFSACSRRQRVLCSACFLGCDAAPRGGIACLAAVWLGCGTASRHGIGHSCRRRVCGMMAHRMCGR